MDILPTLEARSVQCCVTSPPYWGLRDFDSQLGLESTPEEYLSKMVSVFREVWRVLRDDGTLWVNMGDSYGQNQGKGFDTHSDGGIRKALAATRKVNTGLKPKDLCGIPWRLAFALQADGWYLRSDIIWHKPNPMPESCTDRPTKSHEYIFLLTKNERYFYDAEAIREPSERDLSSSGGWQSYAAKGINLQSKYPGSKTSEPNLGIRSNHSFNESIGKEIATTRNKRTVWTVATQPYAEAHFATFPEDLIKPCIMAGSRIGDTVLDPFSGSGTTGKVAVELGRRAVLIELNPKYVEMAEQRCNVTPGMI